ncbi:MAG TPA: ATP-binding protein [Ferruginibacter sp.]|nr:ATP-binding protein [Ferruginibacter sp.]
MGKAEITIFIILINAILLIFIIGIIIFIFQYRKRKILHQKEKGIMEEKHRIELLNTQLEIQQQTMQFIGREIHDSVTQKLTLASIYTQHLEFENQYPGLLEKLKGISRIINDSLDELRELSKNLTDTELQHGKLTDLLKMECDRVNETGICRASFEPGETAGINNAVKISLLRIVQEFIQNSLKHAACQNICIELKHERDGLRLVASDDGLGFDPEAIQSRGIGLNNMRRRIQFMGGILNLQSEKGSGTRLNLFIPEEKLNPVQN